MSSSKIFTKSFLASLRKKGQLQPAKRVQNPSSPPKEAVFFEKEPYTCVKSIIGRPLGIDQASLPRTRRNGGCMQHIAYRLEGLRDERFSSSRHICETRCTANKRELRQVA